MVFLLKRDEHTLERAHVQTLLSLLLIFLSSLDERLTVSLSFSRPPLPSAFVGFPLIWKDAELPKGWLVDEEAYVADPSSNVPDDWDEEEDGEWEPVMVRITFY